MPKDIELKSAYRIIDANYNRAKEGLRVCEEVLRFSLGHLGLTRDCKAARHSIEKVAGRLAAKAALLGSRDSVRDVGREISRGEFSRRNSGDIFFANIQRVKESLRVLEEFSKLVSRNNAIEFKKIRYKIYQIEKKAAVELLLR